MQNLKAVFVCVVCLLGVVGCTRKSGDTDGEDAKLSIAVIPKCTSAEFWEIVEEGAKEAAKKHDVDMRWEGTLTEMEVAEQNKIIENMVSLDVDGIALAALNEKAMRKQVESATAAGIPVVLYDSIVEGDAHVSFVATDNVLGGELAGKHMIELVENKPDAKFVIFRFVQGAASTEKRVRGFHKTVTDAGMQVVAQPHPEDGSVAGCKKTAANTLEGFIRDGKLEIDGVFGCNDRSSMGAVAALDDIRKSGVEVDVKIIGFDFPPKLVAAVQEGKVDALVAQDPHRMGFLTVETLIKHLKGEEVPSFIDTGVKLVTKSALEEDAALRKLVGLKE